MGPCNLWCPELPVWLSGIVRRIGNFPAAPPLLQKVLGALLIAAEVQRGDLSRWKEEGSLLAPAKEQGQMAILPDVCHLPIDQTLLPLNGGYLDLEVWAARPVLHCPWGWHLELGCPIGPSEMMEMLCICAVQ